MGTCAYCKQEKKLTREHIIPKWFIEIDKSPNDQSFLEKADIKFIKEAITKDVCADCNNVTLSKLDSYGKYLYETYFKQHIFKKEQKTFKYEYSMLAKWLLKCTFNSARANGSDLEILEPYGDIIISDDTLPEEFILTCRTIAPSKYNSNLQRSAMAHRRDFDQDLVFPNWFRTGLFRIPNIDTIDFCFRSQIINSYCFLMFIPKIGVADRKISEEISKAVKNQRKLGKIVRKSGTTLLPMPDTDTSTSFLAHMLSNPLTYDLIDDDLSKNFKEEKYENIVFEIHKDDITANNTFEIFGFFEKISSSRELALLYMQKVEFTIGGYDDDPREIYEIDEIKKFLEILNKEFPYWMFYQSPHGIWIEALLLCLSATKNNLEIEPIKASDLTKEWFISLNELCHRFSIGESINRNISEDYNRRIRKLFSSTEKPANN